MVLQVLERGVQVPELLFRLLPQTRIGPEPVRMPDLHEVPIRLPDGLLGCTRREPEHLQPLFGLVLHPHPTLSAAAVHHGVEPGLPRIGVTRDILQAGTVTRRRSRSRTRGWSDEARSWTSKVNILSAAASSP